MLYGKWSKRCREATYEKNEQFFVQDVYLKRSWWSRLTKFPKIWVLKSQDFDEETLLELKTIMPQCLWFPFRPLINVCTKKLRKTSMVEQFSWLWWLNAVPLFIEFMTGKMFWLRRFGPGFQWPKSRSIFWKENQRILDPFSSSLVSTRTFLKSGIF